MEGSRTSCGGAGPSFSNDTLRPVEFLPDKASILCKHVPVEECDQFRSSSDA
jgi:hypothetical protein